MMICPKCHSIMNRVMRFTKYGNYELQVCGNCHFETKPKRLSNYSVEIMQNNSSKNSKKVKEKTKEEPKKITLEKKVKKRKKNKKKGKK